MLTINARNVNHALYLGAQTLRAVGVERESRNGPVLVAPSPVTTVYTYPEERVMLHPGRDANPFFHLVEALWMVAGRDDLGTLTKYVKSFKQFSDDGVTVPGAYGMRWRQWFSDYRTGSLRDQIKWVTKRLRADPNDRRCVIQMWDATVDPARADAGGKDVPCNLVVLPYIGTEGWLDMTVFCRSNDMVLGAYGANAVHFSVLQELIASLLGVQVGRYYQVSNNFHAYLSTLGKAGTEWPWGTEDELGHYKGAERDPYASGEVQPYTMFGNGDDLDWITNDIEMFLDDPARVGIRSGFLRKIACPMVLAHEAYRKGDPDGAGEILCQMPEGNDWQAAGRLWLTNRLNAKLNRKEDPS